MKSETIQKILFSDLLGNLPADDELAEFFPCPADSGTPMVTRLGLEVIKLRLEGYDQKEIGEKLKITPSMASYWSSRALFGLKRGHITERIEIDIPCLRRELGLYPCITNGYRKLSELLRDMPSDEELAKLCRERVGLQIRAKRKYITHQDLYILQQRKKGRRYKSLGQELGIDPQKLRRHIEWIRYRLLLDLKLDLDVPELFHPINLLQGNEK